jgi:hypothetical protein
LQRLDVDAANSPREGEQIGRCEAFAVQSVKQYAGTLLARQLVEPGKR